MNKKVLVLSGSPRKKGNCKTLCEQFIKGAKEAGHETEMIFLSDYNLSPCKACEYCRRNNMECIIKDDADKLIQKMIDADVWVIATPVYFYSVSAQLKLLMDRFFAREYEIRDGDKKREAYTIITSGDPSKENMLGVTESISGFLKVLRTITERETIWGIGAFMPGDAEKHISFSKAYETGKEI